MVFSSMVFLCVFLPVVFGLHLILPGMRAKNCLLVIASLIFYAYGEPIYVIVLILSAFGNYLFARLIAALPQNKKWIMTAAVILNIGLLIFFKYLGFLADSLYAVTGLSVSVPDIKMPIGISFFTFQALSYVIDVYRGTVEAQKNYGKVLLYISYFPQLIAGPIVKYHDVELEINNRKQTVDETGKGIRRFVAGLSKKVLIANTMGMVADNIFNASAGLLSGAGAWIGALSYMLQIYFDFSGYSDMALGLGRMFGFHFKENFDYPYVSSSIREFWRRWHISLSGWFREYLYIPLGGNRKGKFRTVVNKMIVFLVTGIWHGASLNFLFWGAYHGFFLMLEEYVPAIAKKGGRLKSIFQHIYALLAVCIGFVFFRADTMAQGGLFVKKMFTGFNMSAGALSLVMQQLTPVYILTFVCALIACTPVHKILSRNETYSKLTYVFSLGGFLLCILSLAGGTYNPFIYFRF